jgi:hypothetical protein
MSSEQPTTGLPKSVDYTSRDFYSIKNDLIRRIQDSGRAPDWVGEDPSDFGLVLVESFAYLGDLMSYYIDRSANESFISTAVRPSSVLALANSYGYKPSGYKQSNVTLTLSNATAEDLEIPVGTVVVGDVVIGDSVVQVYFTTDTAVTVSAEDSATVTASHGKSIVLYPVTTQNEDIDEQEEYGELLDVSTGDPNATYELSEAPVVDGTVEVFVKDGDSFTQWTRVDYLMDYGSTDLVFTTFYTDNNTYYIQFGDGVSGAIPAAESMIQARYIVGGGTIGNVLENTLTEITYIPGLIDPLVEGLTVTNLIKAEGGAEPESLEQIRILAPESYRAGNRAVTISDYESLAIQVPNVGKAKAIASSPTSVTIYVAPTRNVTDADLNPGLFNAGTEISPLWQATSELVSLKAAVEDNLEEKSLIGTTVTVANPVYVDVEVLIEYKKTAQYETEDVATQIIKQLLTTYSYPYIDFGQTIYPQDIELVAQSVNGVRYAKVTAFFKDGGTGLNTVIADPDEVLRFTAVNISLTEDV